MAEVRKCPAEHCPLWRYRMGKEIRDEICVEIDEISCDFEDDELTSHWE